MAAKQSRSPGQSRGANARLLDTSDAAWLDQFMGAKEIWESQTLGVVSDEYRYCFGSLLLRRSDVWVLRGDWHTVWIAWKLRPGVFDVHVNVLQSGRGKPAVRATWRCFNWLFRSTHCQTLVGFPPAHRREVIRFASICGMIRAGSLPASMCWRGQRMERVVMVMHRSDFIFE